MRVRRAATAPIRALKDGQRGWLVRWREKRDDRSAAAVTTHADDARLKCSYWYVDREDAWAVYRGMLAGQTFEQAHHDLLRASGCLPPEEE